LQKHMEGCEPCKAFLASLEETIRTCRTAPNERLNERTAVNVRRGVLSKYQELMASIRRPAANNIKPS